MTQYFVKERVRDDLPNSPTMRMIIMVRHPNHPRHKIGYRYLTHNEVQQYIAEHALHGLCPYLFSELKVKKVAIWYTID